VTELLPSQCFLQQHNRHFVIGYLLTERRFRLVRLDRSGPMEYPWIDIHTQATVFLKCIVLIAGQDLQKLGFDPKVYYNANGVRCIDVIERRLTIAERSSNPQQMPPMVTYEDVRPLHHSRSIRGSGEVGWAGKLKGSPPNEPEKLIVDRWVHVSRLDEKTIGTDIKKAGVEGVVHLEIWQPRDDEITTGKGRFGNGAHVAQDNGDVFPDLIFTRSVTKLYPSITTFDSKLQLLEVLRDAVLGPFRSLTTCQ